MNDAYDERVGGHDEGPLLAGCYRSGERPISPPLAGVRHKPFKARDVLEFLNLKGEYSEPDLAQGAFSSMQSMKARSAAGTWRRLG